MFTPYIEWWYNCTNIKTIRVNVARLWKEADSDAVPPSVSNENYRRSLNISYSTGVVNKYKNFNAFLVSFFHTREAEVMTKYIIDCQLLNSKYKIGFSYIPNFDCFGCSFKFIVFLRSFIKNSCYACQNDEIFSSLLNMFKGDTKHLRAARNDIIKMKKKSNDPDYWDGRITNDFFVKH